eukprot:Lankesteria_metandrocarpae@DN1609_c0_g1_i1.p1
MMLPQTSTIPSSSSESVPSYSGGVLTNSPAPLDDCYSTTHTAHSTEDHQHDNMVSLINDTQPLYSHTATTQQQPQRRHYHQQPVPTSDAPTSCPSRSPSQQHNTPQQLGYCPPGPGVPPLDVYNSNYSADLYSSQGGNFPESCTLGDIDTDTCSSVHSDYEKHRNTHAAMNGATDTADGTASRSDYNSSSCSRTTAMCKNDDYRSIDSYLTSSTADDGSECSSSSSSCVSTGGLPTLGSMTPLSCFGEYSCSSISDSSPIGTPYTASVHTPTKDSSSDCEASARSLRDIQADLDGMDFNALRRYALQTTERLIQVEQECASLRRGARRHEQAYISMASRRQVSYLTRQNLYLSKVKLIQLRAESDRQERQRLELEVRKMKKLCREAANSLRNGMATQRAVQEKEASLLHQIKEAEGRQETLQQLVDHFREQWDRDKHLTSTSGLTSI